MEISLELKGIFDLRDEGHGVRPYDGGCIEPSTRGKKSRNTHYIRFSKELRKIENYVHGVRVRRGEVLLKVKRHPGDTVGDMKWLPLLTKGDEPADKAAFMKTLLPVEQV